MPTGGGEACGIPRCSALLRQIRDDQQAEARPRRIRMAVFRRVLSLTVSGWPPTIVKKNLE